MTGTVTIKYPPGFGAALAADRATYLDLPAHLRRWQPGKVRIVLSLAPLSEVAAEQMGGMPALLVALGEQGGVWLPNAPGMLRAVDTAVPSGPAGVLAFEAPGIGEHVMLRVLRTPGTADDTLPVGLAVTRVVITYADDAVDAPLDGT
jgi:hypothetical protein